MRFHGSLTPAVLSACVVTFALPVQAVSFQVGHRPEIGNIDAPKTAKAGQPVKMTISAKKEGGSGCGMVVRFGDGEEQQFKVNRDNVKFPLTVEHAYKKNGKYTIRAIGREITTNKECKGSATAAIQVGEPKAAAKGAKP
jgi:hypothetical protein